jgi:hypothetical protein
VIKDELPEDLQIVLQGLSDTLNLPVQTVEENIIKTQLDKLAKIKENRIIVKFRQRG